MRTLHAVTAVSAFILFFGPSEAAYAEVQFQGVISENTIWTASSSPYVLHGETTIAPEASLTIEPGTIVKLQTAVKLNVKGRLEAVGTEIAPIYITSFHDDIVGGDTNQNGTSTIPSDRNAWHSIMFAPGSEGVMRNTVIRYAGYFRDSWPAIHNAGGTIVIESSTIADNGIFGIGQIAGALSLLSSTIEHNEYGIAVLGGDVNLRENTFEHNTNIAVFSTGIGSTTLINNIFTNNETAVDINFSADRVFKHNGNVATGGTYNGLVIRGMVTGIARLTSGDMPYIISGAGGLHAASLHIVKPNNLEVSATGSLSIDPGSVIKFGEHAKLFVEGNLNIEGTQVAPVHFTSYKDNTVGGVTWDKDDTLPQAEDWMHIEFASGSNSFFDYATFRYGGYSRFGGSGSALYNTGGTLEITESELKDNGQHGIRHIAGTTTISESSIHGHSVFGVNNQSNETLNARNNYWGDPSGPYHSTLNPLGLGDAVSDNVLFEPWEGLGCTEACYSNVMFLPGIMGSRLYENGEQLWETDEVVLTKLRLDENGKSISDGIYTHDLIDAFDGPLAFNVDIYRSFLEDLAHLRTSGQITDYAAVPYDWRLAIPDILSSGIEDASGNISFVTATTSPYIEKTLRELAASSKSGKVTIVAHSNGGLVAKALVNQLADEASELIDQIILVATPQLGTPQAIGALLHGFDSGITGVLSEETGRAFAQNAPMTYQLIPHTDYFNNTGSLVNTPLVSFEDGGATQPYIDAYGYAISNGHELHDFIVGAEGRFSPNPDDLENPTRANGTLLTAAEDLQQSIGSSWQPPEGIMVHQIAGVGEDTLAGITYKTIQKCIDVRQLGFGLRCREHSDALSYTPNTVIDGDGTVIVQSALEMSESDSVKRWWVNLEEHNSFFELNKNRDHKNLLEIDSLRIFILGNIITSTTTTLPEYISDTQPTITNGERLRFILHSPLSLSVIDADGNAVSEENTEIPGANYRRFGEVQVVTIPKETSSPTVTLTGVASGSFTLEIEEYDDDSIVATSSFGGIPSATNTVATLSLPESSIETMEDLKVDNDGDGSVDAEIEPNRNEQDEDSSELFALLKQHIQSLDIKKSIKNRLLKLIEKLEKKLEKENGNNQRIFTQIEQQIKRFERKGNINASDSAALVNFLDTIENQSKDMPAVGNALEQNGKSFQSSFMSTAINIENIHDQLRKMLQF